MALPVDLSTLHVLLLVIAAALGILGTVFGWFAKAWRYVRSLFSNPAPATIDIPKQSLIVQPVPGANSCWWHMGTSGGAPAMQISGDLTVTNVSRYKILVTAAKLRKPRILGHAMTRDVGSRTYGSYMIPENGVTDLRFGFWVVPPLLEQGETLMADVAILDQFGNEHWLKKVQFVYS